MPARAPSTLARLAVALPTALSAGLLALAAASFVAPAEFEVGGYGVTVHYAQLAASNVPRVRAALAELRPRRDLARADREAAVRAVEDAVDALDRANPASAPGQAARRDRALAALKVADARREAADDAGVDLSRTAWRRTAPSYALLTVALLLAVPYTLVVRRQFRTRRRVAAGRCESCGYDLRATPNRCPECGAVSPR